MMHTESPDRKLLSTRQLDPDASARLDAIEGYLLDRIPDPDAVVAARELRGAHWLGVLAERGRRVALAVALTEATDIWRLYCVAVLGVPSIDAQVEQPPRGRRHVGRAVRRARRHVLGIARRHRQRYELADDVARGACRSMLRAYPALSCALVGEVVALAAWSGEPRATTDATADAAGDYAAHLVDERAARTIDAQRMLDAVDTITAQAFRWACRARSVRDGVREMRATMGCRLREIYQGALAGVSTTE